MSGVFPLVSHQGTTCTRGPRLQQEAPQRTFGVSEHRHGTQPPCWDQRRVYSCNNVVITTVQYLLRVLQWCRRSELVSRLVWSHRKLVSSSFTKVLRGCQVTRHGSDQGGLFRLPLLHSEQLSIMMSHTPLSKSHQKTNQYLLHHQHEIRHKNGLKMTEQIFGRVSAQSPSINLSRAGSMQP